MPLPDAVTYKIVRAYEHLQALEAEMQRYSKSHPAKMVRQNEGPLDEYVARLETEGPIPGRLPIIMGDFFQNLRSSLDYLIWELVLAAKNTPGKHNMFPVCATPQAFQDAISKQRRLLGIPTDAATLIERLQPYNCGDYAKSILWVIDDFCNINKHRRLLLTRMHGAPAPEDTETKIINGEVWVHVDLSKIKDDAKIVPFPVVDGPEGPGIEMPMKLNILAFVAFNEGATKGMHVTATMAGILKYIYREMLPLFNDFFP
jgi:hypothetical protein